MSEQTLTLLTWLIPAGPLLAFFIIILLLRRSALASWVTAWIAIGCSLIFSWIVGFSTIAEFMRDKDFKKHPVWIQDSIAWMPSGDFSEWLRMGVAVDPLNAVMLIMVPFAVFMIYIYSVGYHNYGQPVGTHLGEPNHGLQEPLFGRFFAFMCLFGGAMLTLTVADNLLLLFVGWEVMGLCSYLLIGFWYARTYEPDPKNAQKLPPQWASVKAFMTTRAADVLMLIGIVWFYRLFGTLNFEQALSADSIKAVIGSTGGAAAIIGVALLIFAGTVGKSAQFPLHVWLPNAMEGPTPVSAVIHAAAMVSAGIYLILRIFPLIAVGIESSSTVSLIIAGIGAFTALMAATIALAQDDVKGVLAYSTISQLGFMVAAIGIGAYIAAAFHLITHAFFKALLFLGSGSVIHGMEHGMEHVHGHGHGHDDHGHDPHVVHAAGHADHGHGDDHGHGHHDDHGHHDHPDFDPQDMLNMGGLKDKMPITFWTFLIGGFALSGFPFVTAGFWSKDEIFADAWGHGTHGDPIAMMVFIVLCIAAFLTAFYTMRQISLTFLGAPRTEEADHAHESNGFMTFPLILLSIPAIAVGWLGIPQNFMLGIFAENENRNLFKNFVGATLKDPLEKLYDADISAFKIVAPEWSWVPLMASLGVAIGGLLLGWLVYGRKPLKAGDVDPLVKWLGPLHGYFRNKWYIDEVYQAVLLKPATYFSEVVVYEIVDRGIIDGILHLVARIFFGIGRISKQIEHFIFDTIVDGTKDLFLSFSKESRYIQTGKIQEYALVSTVIASALTILILAILNGWFPALN